MRLTVTGSRIARMFAATFCVLLVGACSSPAPVPTARVSSLTASAPTGGLSREQAIAAALQQSPSATGALSASQGRAGDFDPGILVVPADTQVWAVVVSGTFPVSCGPALPPGQTHAPCPAAGTTMTVLLDHFSGAFIEGFGSSGPQPTPAPSASPAAVQLPPLSVWNDTNMPFDVIVNGSTITTLSPGTQADPIQAGDLPPLPWAIQARTKDGFVLAAATMNDGRPISGRFDLSCGRIDIWSRVPILGPINGPGHPGDCGPAGLAALFANENLRIDLYPIPFGSPPARIEEAQAGTIALEYMARSLHVPATDPVYTGHGIGYVGGSLGDASVWLVIAKAKDLAPMPVVGPACPPPNDHCQYWAVTDYVGALVSDRSGKVLRSFSTMRKVDPPAGSPSATPSASDRPVDASLEPVSRSNPSDAAGGALRACQVPDLHPLDSVERMARIPHGSAASTYERFTGLEPELKTDKPAWLVEFAGGMYQPIEGETWFGVVCAVVGGRAGFYGTGDTFGSDGSATKPPPVPNEPTLALPTLAP